MKYLPGESLLSVTIPDDWIDPEDDPMLLKAVLDVATEHGADWIELIYKGEQILCRRVIVIH
jgi:hypothetical protein